MLAFIPFSQVEHRRRGETTPYRGVQMLIVQVSVRQTEYTSKGMSYRYKIMLQLVHVSYNSRMAIFSVISDI